MDSKKKLIAVKQQINAEIDNLQTELANIEYKLVSLKCPDTHTNLNIQFDKTQGVLGVVCYECGTRIIDPETVRKIINELNGVETKEWVLPF